jgi:hypothetical protein
MWEVEHVRLKNGTFLVEFQLRNNAAVTRNKEARGDKHAVSSRWEVVGLI